MALEVLEVETGALLVESVVSIFICGHENGVVGFYGFVFIRVCDDCFVFITNNVVCC